MKGRFFWVIIFAFVVQIPVSFGQAGTITVDLGGVPIVVTTTADQDAALASRVAVINAQLVERNALNAAYNAENPKEVQKDISPLQTVEQLVAEQTSVYLAGLVKSDDEALVEKARRGDALSDIEKTRVKSVLGLQ